MREWEVPAIGFQYKLTIHALIRPSGTFSRKEKEKHYFFSESRISRSSSTSSGVTTGASAGLRTRL